MAKDRVSTEKGGQIKSPRILVTQVRSSAGRSKRVKDTLECLGLGRIGKSCELPNNPSIAGMIKKVFSIVDVAAC